MSKCHCCQQDYNNHKENGRTGSNYICSSPRLKNNMKNDKFDNENSSSIFSDYSGSTISNLFRYDSESSNFQDSVCNSPSLPNVQDLLTENAQAQLSDRYSEANISIDWNKFIHIKVSNFSVNKTFSLYFLLLVNSICNTTKYIVLLCLLRALYLQANLSLMLATQNRLAHTQSHFNQFLNRFNQFLTHFDQLQNHSHLLLRTI